MIQNKVLSSVDTPFGMNVLGTVEASFAPILSKEALEFLTQLHRNFNDRRKFLLEAREKRQEDIDNGIMPDFLEETAEIRKGDWTVAPLPQDLLDRRVEITGPVDRKMIINALNSGAKVFMADFEDSNSPTWDNALNGQLNLRDAVEGTITFTNPAKGKFYQLNEEVATLMVRPRGWHLNEKHVEVDGEAMSGSLFDFGLFFFHNAKKLLEKGSGPYFYLPKLESHLEARLWNDVFVFAQEYLDVPQGSIKATVLIETILAAFEMDEILYELRNHSAGLNCGRWDYIFSYIKKFGRKPEFLVPDRDQVGMTVHFMRSYSQLVIQTCHKRNVHAMGGMAAQIPIKNDPEANQAAIEKVRQDKLREVKDGHDGTWVAHPGLVGLAMEIFDAFMPAPNQIDNKREDVNVTAEDLLKVPTGTITEKGLRHNIDVGIQYLEAWLRGNGCVPIYNLMEDAATAEISRSQVWQWLHLEDVKLADGTPLTREFYDTIFESQVNKLRDSVGVEAFESGKFREAATLFNTLVTSAVQDEFLTLRAYNSL